MIFVKIRTNSLLMKQFLIYLICCFCWIDSNAQSLERVQFGGFYQSFDNAQTFAFGKIQSNQFEISQNVFYKAGFLYKRIPAIILINQQNGVNFSVPQVIIYPNPATTTINFYLPPIFNIKQVAVFSSAGSLMYRTTITTGSINISSFAKGLYILQILLEDGNTAIGRFIKN